MSSRRRAYSDDSDDDELHAKKRRRTETVDIEDRLESLITRVGEKSTSSLESNLEGLSTVLEADLTNYKSKIIKILSECVVHLPEKLSVYTTLVGLLNAKNYNCGGEFVEMLVRNLKEALKTSQFDNARMTVRFLADLVNCHVIVASSLLVMFDNFIEVTLEDSIPQVRSDWYVYCVMSALPWVGRELYEKKEADFKKLLQSIEAYLTKRQKTHMKALRVWSVDAPHLQEEYLDCLWAQLKHLQSLHWQEKIIVRPYIAFDSILCEALQHTLPQINPPAHSEEMVYPLPMVVFRMFDFTDVPENEIGGPVLPGSHAIDRYIIEEQLSRIIHSNHLEKKDCAAALLSFPTKARVPINYMILEVVFGQLFRLPRPPYIEICYGSLLIELCKLQPGSMPQVLAQATEMLYERIDTMDTACIDRFSNWFSYHVSNFQFKWSWEEWKECTTVDLDMPKPKFVKECFQRCMRLSYHQRLLDTIPEEIFGALLPAKPAPNYKYDKDGAGSLPGTMAAHRLIASIKTKCTPEEAIQCMKDLPNPNMEEDDVIGFNPLQIDVFVSTLLNMGAKSFSHSFAAMAKFHYVFRVLAEQEDAQIQVLNVMYELWKTHQQMMVVLVDKMLKTQIVECSAVANWVFSDAMSHELTSFYIWELLHSTIRKMNKHVVKLQKDVDEARDKFEAADRKSRDMDDDDTNDDDAPTEESIERLEERLDVAQGQQKNLFLIVFQRFIIILTTHLAQCEAESKDFNTPWYKWIIERLRQVFLMHNEQVNNYITTLETLMFTSDIDPHILEVFQQFCALRS